MEKCVDTNLDMQRFSDDRFVSRNGNVHHLQVILDFDGKGNFHALVMLDQQLVLTGKYQTDQQYQVYPRQYLKHGNYSRYFYDYQLISEYELNESQTDITSILLLAKPLDNGFGGEHWEPCQSGVITPDEQLQNQACKDPVFASMMGAKCK